MTDLPLKRFEYCIPGPGTASDCMKKVSIDFEKGKLSVTGDIGLVPDNSRKVRRARSTSAKEWIEVRATIYPGHNGRLAGFSADDLIIFSLQGIMEDSKHINSCSGLLVLDNLTDGDGPDGSEWHATLYLYDDNSDGREIKLRWTMYSYSANAELN
jgi:hypothetical protein